MHEQGIIGPFKWLILLPDCDIKLVYPLNYWREEPLYDKMWASSIPNSDLCCDKYSASYYNISLTILFHLFLYKILTAILTSMALKEKKEKKGDEKLREKILNS